MPLLINVFLRGFTGAVDDDGKCDDVSAGALQDDGKSGGKGVDAGYEVAVVPSDQQGGGAWDNLTGRQCEGMCEEPVC
ncbi:hypothetical protein [Culturomica sp.]|uniref:hypothetical protein n=1 Tax=Culturomica sp. TaxID=1926652 RepID=UPI000E933EC3|nr:hypothetical protein [Culturomica sp.]HBO25268.1 hypothetical protein [Culturomica sp.]